MRLVLAVAMMALVCSHVSLGQTPLTVVGTIDLPGVEGRIDHLGVDTAGQRLYVAALGNSTVEVLDTKAASHIKSLPGFREPQGIASVPDAKLIAVANGQGEGLQLLNADDYRPGQMVRLGDDSDNVRYDASAKRVYVGFGTGALAAISPTDAKVLGEAKLAGHPESFQLERSGSRIFVNVPTANQIAVIDRAAMTSTVERRCLLAVSLWSSLRLRVGRCGDAAMRLSTRPRGSTRGASRLSCRPPVRSIR